MNKRKANAKPNKSTKRLITTDNGKDVESKENIQVNPEIDEEIFHG